MDHRRPTSPFSSLLLFLLSFLSLLLGFIAVADGTGVLRVHRKFPGRHPIPELRAHDLRRHGRALSAIDLPIGGNGSPTETGLYYTEIGIGTPSKNYYVQVDTGSDIMWVNCIDCNNCPQKSNLKEVKLTLYDPKSSGSSSPVSCADNFCLSTYGEMPGCTPDALCNYKVVYGDGSGTAGYFIKDYVEYNQVSGDHQTKQVNASIIFGCGAQQSGDLGSANQALDGILGFGQSNSSVISQLASAGKVKKIFAHCLDTVNGGGIFAIGNVVEPKVKTTPLVPNQPHYNVNLKAIEVGGAALSLPTDLFDNGDGKGTIIDSGTTLSYLPDKVYRPLMDALNFQKIQDFVCFRYSRSVDDGFPEIVFNFENSLSLNVYPHDYLFQNEGDIYCVGWQNGGMQSRDAKDTILLGDLALSNKLVLYDLENQVIGWTDYNCSSSIKIQDDQTKAVYTVDAQNLSSACRLELGMSIVSMLLTIMMFYLIH